MLALSQEQEHDLIARAKAGENTAKVRLIEQYTPLLRKFVSNTKTEIPQEDLFQEASIALLNAIDKFDLARGTKFMTYIYKAIPRRLWRAEQSSSLVTVASNVRNEKYKPFAKRAKQVGSLNVRDFDDGPERIDALTSSEADPAERTAEREETELLRKAIKNLKYPASFIVKKRLAGCTLENISIYLGISTERVRQIEEQAHFDLAALIKRPRTLATYSRWAAREVELIYELHPSSTIQVISGLLGRPYTSTVAKARSLGLSKNNPSWSEEEDAFLRLHRGDGWTEVARLMPGRSTIAVYNRARRLGIQHKMLRAQDMVTLRALHADGMTTTRIGLYIGVSDECIRVNLKRLDLVGNKRDEQQRLRNLRATLLEKFGETSLHEIKKKQRRAQALSLGWGDLPLLAAMVLESLKRIGRAANREEIANSIKCISDDRGWTLTRSWRTALRWVKWLRDSGKVTESRGRANCLRYYWFAESAIEKATA